jgi:hypothetical protein
MKEIYTGHLSVHFSGFHYPLTIPPEMPLPANVSKRIIKRSLNAENRTHLFGQLRSPTTLMAMRFDRSRHQIAL